MAHTWRPGWYPDGHGQERWWDGRGWTTFSRAEQSAQDTAPIASAPTPATAPPPGAQAPTARPVTGVRRRTVAMIAGASAVVGILLGAAVHDDPDPVEVTEASEYVALEAKYRSAVDDRDSLAATAATAPDPAALDDRQAQLDAREAELKQTAARLKTKAKKLANRAAALSSETKAQSTPDEAPATSVYYANCTAARNAGAAPVREGDPGYARHLDRDGDGVGCE